MELSSPYAPGSIAIGLHPVARLSAEEQAEHLIEQATVADSAGFDGVTLSEHHGDFDGYMPQPLLAANWILSATRGVWSGTCPTLLPIRNPRLLLEEMAWSAARHPGRIGFAFAPGYSPQDFEAAGVPTGDLGKRFAHALDAILDGPDDPVLSGDQAISDWRDARPPLLSAAHSLAAVKRAAQRGLGIVLIGGPTDDGRARELVETYQDAGGDGPVVWIRRVWMGTPSEDALKALAAAYGDWDTSKGSVSLFVDGSLDRIVDVVSGELEGLGVPAALNLRVHLPQTPTQKLLEQISRVGSEVVPALRGR